MRDNSVPCVVVMTIEIEIPGSLPDDLQDAMVDDLADEGHLDRLQNIIKRWARFITGVACYVGIDVE